MDMPSGIDATAATANLSGAIPMGSRITPDPAAVDRTAHDFEAFFVTSMIESMSAGIKTSSLFGGGEGEKMYRSLLNQEYGKAIASRGALGISDAIRRDMIHLQEAANSHG